MKLVFCALLLLVLVTPAMAAERFEAQILAAHNAERNTLKIPPLTWNEDLATGAAAWAKHLAETGDWEHASAAVRKGAGENLWDGTAGAFTTQEMVDGWIGEKRFYSYGPFPSGGMIGGHAIGHYTQMIWRDTREIGCAMATGHGDDILVCRYSPAGNIVGQTPY